MTINRFRARVGRRYVRSSVAPVTAEDTYASRAAMKDVIKNFESFAEHIENETINVLLEAMKPVFDLSQKYVPVDTSKLKNSGYLEVATDRKGMHSIEIGYGKNGQPDYAATVHENLEFRHKAPTRAKFLQGALEELDKETERRIIEGLKQAGGL
tara:strand:+ start:163 stop:627 length:465 start_codon:yes stop_codon:yes gene_type:complete